VFHVLFFFVVGTVEHTNKWALWRLLSFNKTLVWCKISLRMIHMSFFLDYKLQLLYFNSR